MLCGERAVTNKDTNKLTATNAMNHKQIEMAVETLSATGWCLEPRQTIETK